MREILFRGKLKAENGEFQKGEWVYGDFVTLIDGKEKHPHIYGKGEVKAETIGQFTGLTDKNGTKIFDGDIVEGHCHSQWRHCLQRCVVVYDRDSFKSRHYLNFPNEKHYFEYKVLFSKDVVVIGNIHDNPELLESKVQGE